jgi:tubulin polyglutamylase TTLL6/13
MSVNTQDINQSKVSSKKSRIVCNVIDTEYDVIKEVVAQSLAWKISLSPEEDWDITWTDNYVPSEKLSKMKLYQKINHFPGMHGICKKNYLAWNLNKMLKLFPNDYNFYPKTWVLPGDYKDFKSHVNKKKVFIVKPEASSQGRGIFLIRRIDDINCSDRYLVQEYLNDPYLIDGLKFDLRIYVLVTGCNPLRVFIHEDGLTRLATESYTSPNASNLENMCLHLTNYAVNKNNPKFIFNTDPEQDNIGHKRSLKSTYEYLESKGKNIQELKQRIEDIILKTLLSVQPSLSNIYKSCQPDDCSNGMCFELLGFDIIIDSSLNPILLEVNHSPSFSTDSPLDWKVKHRVIKETLQILGAKTTDRKNFYSTRKADIERKTFSFKEYKETKEQRAEKTLIAVEKRNNWENKHLGGFKRLFPSENGEKYEVFLKAASQLWNEITAHGTRKKPEEVYGSSIKKIPKPILPAIPKRPLSLSLTYTHKKTFIQNTAIEENEEKYDNEAETNETAAKNYEVLNKNIETLDLLSYKQLSEILKNKRQASSIKRH